MKRTFTVLMLILVGLSSAVIRASPQNADATATDHSAPSYDMKGQSLLELGEVQKKFVALANALPADKFTWLPSADARSFAEVFLHVAGERHGFLNLMGAELPTGFDAKALEKSTSDRARIVEQLNKSWEFTQKTIKGMSNADFARLLPKLGPEANAGDVVYSLVIDADEHLGQAVAYARENGIVPPWTEEAKKHAQGK